MQVLKLLYATIFNGKKFTVLVCINIYKAIRKTKFMIFNVYTFKI